MSAGTIGFIIGMIVGIGFGMLIMDMMTASGNQSRSEECRYGKANQTK